MCLEGEGTMLKKHLSKLKIDCYTPDIHIAPTLEYHGIAICRMAVRLCDPILHNCRPIEFTNSMEEALAANYLSNLIMKLEMTKIYEVNMPRCFFACSTQRC